VALESGWLSDALIKSGALVPVFPDRKGIRVHAHHLVYPEAHGKWSKVECFVGWLRREAGSASNGEKGRGRIKQPSRAPTETGRAPSSR
jgi:LysR family glycine cleavage system transcriptional activator